MKREFRTVTLPSGLKAEIKSELTIGEFDSIKGFLTKDLTFNFSKGEVDLNQNIKADVIQKAKYKAIEEAVIKFIDSEDKETPPDIENIKNLSMKDFDMLQLEVDKLTEDELNKDTKKKSK